MEGLGGCARATARQTQEDIAIPSYPKRNEARKLLCCCRRHRHSRMPRDLAELSVESRTTEEVFQVCPQVHLEGHERGARRVEIGPPAPVGEFDSRSNPGAMREAECQSPLEARGKG